MLALSAPISVCDFSLLDLRFLTAAILLPREEGLSSSPNSMEIGKVCDICGDFGAAELISTCFKCNIAREHIYCMQLFRRRVPKVWFCNDCLNDMFALESGAVDTRPRKGKRTLLARKKKNIGKNSLMPAKEAGTPSMEIQDWIKCEPLPSEDAVSLHNSGGKLVTDINSIHYDVEGADLVNILPKLKKFLVNNPATGATWCGSFEIVDSISCSEFYNGFLSYPPVRVHRKAYHFSKQMPGVLLSTLLPRCNIWESIFKNDLPDENDIALYFFPSSFERSKQQYVRLLQRMDKEDLVLRSYINGVELLIFTSKWLYVSSVLKMEPFLWGIFRTVRGNQTVSLPSCDIISQTPGQIYNIGTKVEEQLLKVKEESFTYLDVLSMFSTQAFDEASEEMGLGTQLQVQRNFL